MSCPLNPMSTCNAPGERCDRCPLDIECSECGEPWDITEQEIENEETICPVCRAKEVSGE